MHEAEARRLLLAQIRQRRVGHLLRMVRVLLVARYVEAVRSVVVGEAPAEEAAISVDRHLFESIELLVVFNCTLMSSSMNGYSHVVGAEAIPCVVVG